MPAGMSTVRISNLCALMWCVCKQITVYEMYCVLFGVFGVTAETGPILSASLY